MGTKSDLVSLKALVEAQSGRLRDLATEIERNANNASWLTKGTRQIQRDWAAVARSIADELVREVNSSGDRNTLSALVKWGVGAATAVALYVQPTSNAVLTDAAEQVGVSEKVAELSTAVIRHSDTVQAALAESPHSPEPDAGANPPTSRVPRTLEDIVHDAFASYDPTLDDLAEASEQYPACYQSEEDPEIWDLVAGPMTVSARIPIRLDPDESAVASAIEWVVMELYDDAKDEMAEELAIQNEIDKRRGK